MFRESPLWQPIGSQEPEISKCGSMWPAFPRGNRLPILFLPLTIMGWMAVRPWFLPSMERCFLIWKPIWWMQPLHRSCCQVSATTLPWPTPMQIRNNPTNFAFVSMRMISPSSILKIRYPTKTPSPSRMIWICSITAIASLPMW